MRSDRSDDPRAQFVRELAKRLSRADLGRPLRVGIDGRCGSGKSILARDLVAELVRRGRNAVHVDSDGFHNVREIRYRQGRSSAQGYYDDAYDFAALAERVLVPLGPGGSLVYAVQVHDMASDEIVTGRTAVASPSAIVVFDCTFLQRGALRALWDVVIYLQVDRDVAIGRGVARDASSLGGVDDARSAYQHRYMAACDIYEREERPAELADIVVAYDDPLVPTFVR